MSTASDRDTVATVIAAVRAYLESARARWFGGTSLDGGWTEMVHENRRGDRE